MQKTDTSATAKQYLVLCDRQWHVATKANGVLYQKRIIAWLDALSDKFICEVGKENQWEDLPEPKAGPTWGDQFPVYIDQVDQDYRRIKVMAAFEHYEAGLAALEVIKALHPQTNTFELRVGGMSRVLAMGSQGLPHLQKGWVTDLFKKDAKA